MKPLAGADPDRVQYVRRRYLIALAVVALGAAGFAVVPGVVASSHAQQDRHDRVLTAAAFRAIKPPKDFVAVGALDGAACPWRRCYLARESTFVVAAKLPGILRSAHIRYTTKDSSCGVQHPQGRRPFMTCQISVPVAGNHGIIVSLEPYLACSTPTHCRWTNDSQVLMLQA